MEGDLVYMIRTHRKPLPEDLIAEWNNNRVTKLISYGPRNVSVSDYKNDIIIYLIYTYQQYLMELTTCWIPNEIIYNILRHISPEKLDSEIKKVCKDFYNNVVSVRNKYRDIYNEYIEKAYFPWVKDITISIFDKINDGEKGRFLTYLIKNNYLKYIYFILYEYINNRDKMIRCFDAMKQMMTDYTYTVLYKK